MNDYRNGDVCRLLVGVQGCDLHGLPVYMPEGAMVSVALLDRVRDDNGLEAQRYIVRLLDEHGAETAEHITTEGVYTSNLQPEPGIIRWRSEDSAAASRQGWDIFYVGGSSRQFELERVDEAARFATDAIAWRFVWDGAVEHEDPLAQRALAFLRQRSPHEYVAIARECPAKTERKQKFNGPPMPAVLPGGRFARPTTRAEADMRNDAVEDVVRRLAAEYTTGENAFPCASDINNGSCEDFALAVCALLPEAVAVWDVDVLSPICLPSPAHYGHCFVCCGGRYYDAECPAGVDCWLDLPYYKNRLAAEDLRVLVGAATKRHLRRRRVCDAPR